MQNNDSLAILTADDIISLLNGREREIMGVIEAAYRAHARGNTNCPYSQFLTLPQRGNSRIIALPAYIGEEMDVAGLKWISSFPSNPDLGLPRASALIVLNSMETGRAALDCGPGFCKLYRDRRLRRNQSRGSGLLEQAVAFADPR